MKITGKILLVIFLINISFNCYSQGKVDKSKDELKKGKVNKQNYNTHYYSSSDDSSDNIFTEIITKAFLYVTVYSLIGNYKSELHLRNELTKYPYYNNESHGNYEYCYTENRSDISMRLDIQNNLLLSATDIQGNHLKVKFRPSKYFYLQGDYNQLIEFNATDNGNSYLSLFSLNFGYDRLRFEKVNLGWTIGANYVANDVNKFGFTYGLNTDLFLIRNLSLSASARWGKINNVPVNIFEIKARYHQKRYFYSIGYENIKIGSPEYDFGTIEFGIHF